MLAIRQRCIIRLLAGLILLISAFSLTSFGYADESPVAARQLKVWVAQRIAGLDAATIRERNTAERELLAAGPPVLALLPDPGTLRGAAVKQAVIRIRRELERRLALDSIQASQVTGPSRGTLAEILAAVTEQTGNVFVTSSLSEEFLNRPASLPAEEQTFWQTLQQLQAAHRFSIAAAGETTALELLPGKQESPAVAVSNVGAFRIAVESASYRNLLGNATAKLARLKISIAGEPRLRPLFLEYLGRDFQLAGVNTIDGQTATAIYPPFNSAASIELPLGDGRSFAAMQQHFVLPISARPETLTIQGKMQMTVAAGEAEIVFRRLHDVVGSSRRSGGVAVRVLRWETTTNDAGIRKAKAQLEVAYDAGGPAFETHRSWIFHNRVELRTAGGEVISRDAQFSTDQQANRGVLVEYNFTGLKQPLEQYELVYVAPTLITEIPLRFTIRNVHVKSTHP